MSQLNTSFMSSSPQIGEMNSINSSVTSPLQNATNENCYQSFSREIPLTEKVAKATAYAVLMLMSLVGNSLVITIVSGTKSMWTTTNLLIVNMAVSDFMMSLCAVPRVTVEIFSQSRRWLIQGTFGLLLCKLAYFFQDVSTAISIQSLVVISVDRFSAIVFPYRAPLIKTKFCKVVIPAIWLVGCAIHSVYFYVVKIYKVDDRTYCDFSWEPAFDNKKTQEAYYLIVLVLLVILPLLIVTILHCVMIAELCKSKSGYQSSPWTQRRRRENAKVMGKIIVIVISFVICIIPINVGAILFYFVWDWVVPCGIDIHTMFFLMRFILFSNASTNPCLYFTLYKRYRRGLRNLFEKLYRREMLKRTYSRESSQRRHLEDAV